MTILYKIALGLTFALVLFMSQIAGASGPAAINLGTSGEFAILTQTGISTTGTTSIVGDIGVSPAAASYLTGFGLVNSSNNEYSTSSYLTGDAFAADYNTPTPAIMTQAISDMQTAYNNAAGASTTNASMLNLASGNLNGQTLTPGVYILQISGTLNTASGAQIVLTNGAQAQDIFWQVSGQTTLGTGSAISGVILDKTGIAIQTGATLIGSALAQTAVTLDAATVTQSTGSGTVPLNGTSTATTTTTIAPSTNTTSTITTPAATTTVSGTNSSPIIIAATTTVSGQSKTTIQQGSAQGKGTASTAIITSTTAISDQGTVSATPTTTYQGTGTYRIMNPSGSMTDQYVSNPAYFSSLLSSGYSLTYISRSNIVYTTPNTSVATSTIMPISGRGGSVSVSYCTGSYGFLQGTVTWLYQLLGWKC
jgi:hypothetical protein